MSLIVRDPIRDALRQLVTDKRIVGWSPATAANGWTWTVVHPDLGAKPYTTDEVNGLIGMFWEAS